MTPKEIVTAGERKRTMNVETINALLVKAIGQIQETEIAHVHEAKKPYDPSKYENKFQLTLSLRNNKLIERYYKNFDAAEKGLKNAIKKDLAKNMIARASITPPGEITWNDIVRYDRDRDGTFWKDLRRGREILKVYSK